MPKPKRPPTPRHRTAAEPNRFEIPEPTTFDKLATIFAKQVDHLTNLKCLVDLFGEFLGKGSPEEIALLMCTLSDRVGPSGMPLEPLVECMRSRVKFNDDTTAAGGAGRG